MNDTDTKPAKVRAERQGHRLGWATGVAFAAFMVNVLLGKLRDDFDWSFVVNLGKTGEFLLLLLTGILLVATALRLEAAQDSATAPRDAERSNQ